ncbi:MAG: hypothetical protein FWC23_04185, partial [Chitinispirillia bacterium]|nr:hypothetical protein [Chitinispirillia bacterium]
MYQGETKLGREGGGCEDGGCPEQVAADHSRREVCVWERDIFGYPTMRCYNTYYHSSWMYFQNTPWWYRSSFGWNDTRGCPPFYYYDRYMGYCRYYGSSYPPPNSGQGGAGGGTRPQEPRPTPPSMRSVPSESAASEPPAEQAPMFQGATFRNLSPAGAPVHNSVPPASSAGSSDGGMAKPSDEGVTPPRPPQQQPPSPHHDNNSEERQRPRMRGM